MLRNPLPNGSRRKARNSPHLHGNQDTVHLPFQNPMLKPSANTSLTNANTTTRKPFKRNTGHSSNAITLCSMNDTCGIDRRCLALRYLSAGALPLWSPKGASHASPGQRPGNETHIIPQALKGRPKPCPNPRPACMVRPGLQPSIFFKPVTQGVALGYLGTGLRPCGWKVNDE